MKTIIFLVMLVIGCCVPSKAQTITPAPTSFVVFLRGAYEVPPNDSPVTGSGWFTLDGNMLNFAVGGFSPSLIASSNEELNAGIYGPAPVGKKGRLIFRNLGWGIAVPQGITYAGGFELTRKQIKELQAGLWYVNIKSPAFPNGEVRGQICPLTPDCDCDGDDVPDKDDHCLNTPPGATVDVNGCSIEQLCPCSGPWKNHKEYVNSIREQAFRFWRARRISVHERNAIVKEAEKSNCGNSTRHWFPSPILPNLRLK